MRPLIGVPGQTLQAIDGIPTELPQSWVMNHRYFTALASVGGAPVMVPLIEEETALRGIYEDLDGIFLAGGVDVDPESYHEPRAAQSGRTDPPRDRVEIQLARWAQAEGKPLFGVCRGMQIMNVAAGGSLYQDCAAYFEGAIKHDYFPNAGYARNYLAHAVRITAGTRLHEVLRAGEVQVNSMHHQGLKEIADGLRPSAVAPDGLIEALEAPGEAFCVGVQWHPEMLVDDDAGTRRLFEDFVAAASAYRLARAW
ncbi:MAG TPA: gamma-glutamyl-gamma-aminobutyrate hydrolase family protein [Longimicrobiales bacterium]|nr:gamma-glutamyl-gamma-aminobutyrate hydrolase family protein [Longimicrobiales bacterium]